MDKMLTLQRRRGGQYCRTGGVGPVAGEDPLSSRGHGQQSAAIGQKRPFVSISQFPSPLPAGGTVKRFFNTE